MLILNRDFKMSADGFYQIAPLGEFPHVCAGVLQVIDQEACVAMAARFAADAAVANFAGLLIDFDHFSMQGGQRSEAAGWITALEARAGSGKGQAGSAEGDLHPNPLPSQGEGSGLWAQIRWSDVGEEAVKGGRYRFLSPVWSREDCVDLGPDTATGYPRLRPVRLLNAAVTNDPNLRGLRPLSNSGRAESGQREAEKAETGGADAGPGVENRHSGNGTRVQNGRPSDAKAMEGKGAKMKTVIEKLLNHLGLAADAAEAVILEKLGALPAAGVVAELQNSLTAARTELDALKAAMKVVEGELVNRHLAEFEGVVTEKTKGFWTEQLVANRAGALAALAELATLRDGAGGKAEAGSGKGKEAEEATRKPLHNRATARPVPPGQAAADGDSKAVKIRNRAHEIAGAEKVPFGVAFRRAEKEVSA